MFTKLEQYSWIKIEVAWGCNTQECFQGMCEACGDAALPYCTVARWVKAFQEGRDAIQDNLHTRWPHMENNTVQLLVSLLDAGRRWTAYDLAAEVRVCHKTVFHILHDILGYNKTTACWIPMKFLWWSNGTTMQSRRPSWTGSKWKVTTFLEEYSLWTKPVLTDTNQINGSILVLLAQKKGCPTQCAVHGGVRHW